MPTWDPNQYLKFSDHRLRPALDLMAQVHLENPHSIYDLGSGPGNITRLLAQRWPGAAVTGVELTEWRELKTAQRLAIA